VVSIHPVSDLSSLLSLEQVKPDAYLGAGPVLGWGRIYGGQVVAQALRAAGLTIDDSLRAQSLHAYFVQAGDERQPVLYEVERVRDSSSFATRQVVAYQARGAVLNLIASFHRPEDSIDLPAGGPFTIVVSSVGDGIGAYSLTLSSFDVDLLAPIGGETWKFGERRIVTWKSGAPSVPATVTLFRSGVTGPAEVLFSATANDGLEAWRVTPPASPHP